jgi:hypothetical protein
MAWDFDGTNDYMEATSAVLTAGPLTFSAWINIDATGIAHRILSISSTTGNDRWSLFVGATNVISFQVGASSSFFAVSTTASVGTGTWYHVAGTYSTAANQPMQVYLDGTKIGPTNSNRTPTAGNLNRTLLGSTYVTSALTQYLNGRIAEAAIWDVVLSDAEISSLAKNFRSDLIRPASLKFYMPLIREVQDVRAGLSFTNNATAAAAHVKRYG